MSNELYAQPERVASPDDCFFYHYMDLPSAGTVGTTWDLRNCVDDYLGRLNYLGKRTLDVGTASGFLSFEMEKRGAEVVSFDMPSVDSWNFVPHFSLKEHWKDIVKDRSRCHQQMQSAYWFAHQQLNSKARVHYGDVYNLPRELGNFDVVFMGMILPHLRDPFQALYSASRLASDTMIVTNPGRKPRLLDRVFRKRRYQAKFLPSRTNNKCDVWWALSNSCIERMLESIGFQVVDRIECKAACHLNGSVKQRRNLAIVAKRFAGSAEGVASEKLIAAA